MAKSLVAVIDIGSLTARLKIYEIGSKGTPKAIETVSMYPDSSSLNSLKRSVTACALSILSAKNTESPESCVWPLVLSEMPETVMS